MTVGISILSDKLGLANRYLGGHPYVWPTVRFPIGWQTLHEQQSPSTPFFIAEFQGGAGDGW